VEHGNEQAHAAHVASLALSLFDATADFLDVPAEDRPLLEAACRLHEVGYGGSPRRHARAGYEIVRDERLEGFTSSALDDIAAAIYLHPARPVAAADRSLDRRLRSLPRARRLAAYLRVADGLDAAHIQDAAIVAVQKTEQTICIHVACNDSSPGLAQAERKADLWHEVFPLKLLFVRAVRGPAPLLSQDLPVVEGARRLLYLGFSGLFANVHGALDGADPEALHKARVGIRRMRAVLRAFRKPLKPTTAGRIDRDLQHLNAILGEVRDLDVWIDLLTGKTLQQQLATHPHGRRYIDYQVALRRLQQATVRRHLGGPSFAALQARIGRLLRIELPQLVPTSSAGSLGHYSRRVLAKNLGQALDLADFRNARDLDKLHRLRIALRRVRYLGAAFGEILGPSVGALVKRIHGVEGALGRLRDTDLAFARIRREGPPPPRMLVLRLEHRRQKAAAELTVAWRKLAQPGFLAGVSRRLES
jgi:CHAD domain-containing protein